MKRKLYYEKPYLENLSNRIVPPLINMRAVVSSIVSNYRPSYDAAVPVDIFVRKTKKLPPGYKG